MNDKKAGPQSRKVRGEAENKSTEARNKLITLKKECSIAAKEEDLVVKMEMERISQEMESNNRLSLGKFQCFDFLERALNDESKFVQIQQEFDKRFPVFQGKNKGRELNYFYLMAVVADNRLELLEKLIARPDTNISDYTEDGSALHLAALRNSSAVISILCNEGGREFINLANGRGHSAWMIAAFQGHLECLKEFYKVKLVEWHSFPEEDDTWCHLTTANKDSKLTLIEYMVKKVKSPEVKDFLKTLEATKVPAYKMQNACASGDGATVQRLLAAGVDVNNQDGRGCFTPLEIAMGRNQTNIVKILLERPETKLVTESLYGTNPLHNACTLNSAEVISLFCNDKRITEEIVNQKELIYETTPLMRAVYAGNLKCVKELSKVKGVDWETKDSLGRILMEVAQSQKKMHIVRYLKNRANQTKQTAVNVLNVEDLVTFIEGTNTQCKTKKNSSKKKVSKNPPKLQIEENVEISQSIKDGLLERTEIEKNSNEDIKRQNKGKEEILNAEDEVKGKVDKMIGFLKGSIATKESELECPTCLEVAPPPLYMCQDSHLICSACRPRLDRCPLCRVPLPGSVRRHRFAEKLYQDLKELEMQREMISGA